MTVVVTGTVTLDTIEYGPGLVHEGPGGSALYAAAAASLQGPAAVVGTVGTDFPHERLAFLRDRAVLLDGLVTLPGPTFRWRARYGDHNRERVTLERSPGVSAGVVPAVPVAWTRTRTAVLLACTDPSVQLGVLDQVPDPLWVGLDSMEHWIRDRRSALASLLPDIDVLFATGPEVRLLAQRNHLEKAVECVGADGPSAVVVKRGAGGSSLWRRDRPWLHVPAFRAPGSDGDPATSVETTGAGDAYAGGFMAKLMADSGKAGLDDDRTAWSAMVHASVVAGLAVSRPGLAALAEATPANMASLVADFTTRNPMRLGPINPPRSR